MSPRRRVQPGEVGLLVAPTPETPRRWGLPLVATGAALVMAAAITVCTLTLIAHGTQRQATLRDVAALDYVQFFMTRFTSPDPFHANDYVNWVFTQATGDFAQEYHDRENEILIQVARIEPTTGTVLDAGVERWNDDGSANVLVATKFTSKSPEGKPTENANRWVATAKKEGDQWKISNLIPVM